MTADPRIHAGITQMLLVAAGHAGLSRQAIIEEAGLSERSLVDADGRIPLSAHRAVGEAIIARAGGRDLAAMVTDVASPAAFGVVGKLLQNSVDLRAALTSLARYQQLVLEGSRLGVASTADGAMLVVQLPAFLDELRHPMISIFAVFITIGRQLTGMHWSPTSVALALEARPGDMRSLTPIYGVAPTFAAEQHAMRIDSATLALPIAGARPDREAMFRAYADALMSELELLSGVAADVCRVLVTRLPQGITRQNEIAKALGMSVRTLGRKLHAEGTTFGELLERVRKEMAQTYLRDASLSVHEVSLLLGYAEPSTFFRAFKRWTGTTPRAWRAHPA